MNKLALLRLLALILILVPFSSWSQDMVYKGKIVNGRGQAIGFASIRTEKKQGQLLANEKGEFEILLSPGATLRIASGGYEEKLITLKDQAELTIELELATGIDELENSSASLVKTGMMARELDSLYANDIIVQRDIQLPDSLKGLSVFPNKVGSGGNISLGIQLLESGQYDYHITDEKGKQVFSKGISLDRALKQVNLTLPALQAGTYRFVLVSRTTGRSYQQTIQIV